MAPALPYTEGDVFAVPLAEDGYAVGVVARMDGQGIVVGYFFGPLRGAPPEANEFADLHAVDNVLVQRFGDVGLIRGKWPILGPLPNWRREEWPTPAFGRHEELTSRYFRVEYPDDYPNGLPRESQIARDEFDHLPEDGLAGFGFVEARLTQLLTGGE